MEIGKTPKGLKPQIEKSSEKFTIRGKSKLSVKRARKVQNVSAKNDFIKCQNIFQIKTFRSQRSRFWFVHLDEFVFYDDLFTMKLIMRSQLRFNFNFIQCNVSACVFTERREVSAVRTAHAHLHVYVFDQHRPGAAHLCLRQSRQLSTTLFFARARRKDFLQI